MFNFIRNKAISVVTDELDGCLSYVTGFGPNSSADVDQILNTIHHFVQEIANDRASEQDVQKHFMKMKTEIAIKKNLTNHRDIDYSKAYILNAFFTCVASNGLSESKSVGIRILNFCADNCSKGIVNAARELRNDYSKIFK
jgi:hypothetical protein